MACVAGCRGLYPGTGNFLNLIVLDDNQGH